MRKLDDPRKAEPKPEYIRARLKPTETNKMARFMPTDEEVAEARGIVAKSDLLRNDSHTQRIIASEGVLEQPDEGIVYNLREFLASRLKELRNPAHPPNRAAYKRAREIRDADNTKSLGSGEW